MSKTKSLRRSLLASVVSLATCATMFVGTTFAWFTDSVSSQNNLIVSGNLDVELEYLDANDVWQPVTKDTNVFMNNTLWEPGHTEVVYLKVSNVGSLALNYKLGVNIVEEVTSINVKGEKLQLSNYIFMGAIEDVKEAYDDRKDARDALDGKEILTISQGYAQDGVLFPKNNMPDPADIADAAYEEYVALVVYMPEYIGNEANYKLGEKVPKITLGIELLATQKTYEEDSFGPDYDEGANTTAPPVPVSKQTIDEVTVFDVFSAGNPQTTLTDLEVDVYEFIANDYKDAYPVDQYKDWTCDFFVSTDSPVETGLILLGNYGTFGWLGFWVPENDQAYEPVGLLGVVSSNGESNWTYEGIHNDVRIFRCGLIDYEENNAGVKVTVDLRMKSPDKTQTITVTSITVTL